MDNRGVASFTVNPTEQSMYYVVVSLSKVGVVSLLVSFIVKELWFPFLKEAGPQWQSVFV